MKKADVEPKLAEIMNTIPECEGLIAVDPKGKVIVGQTIDESMDHAAIAKAVQGIVKGATGAAELVKKNGTTDVTVSYNDGFIQVVVEDTGMIIGLMGSDGRNSLSLLMRNMKTVLK